MHVSAPLQSKFISCIGYLTGSEDKADRSFQ
jgi:hypothetical protein